MARKAREQWRPQLLGPEAIDSCCTATKREGVAGKLSYSLMPLKLDIAAGETDGAADSMVRFVSGHGMRLPVRPAR
jgi:hypothetical protein